MTMRFVTVGLGLLLTSMLHGLSAAEPVTLTGEVVDRACYVDRGLHGPDHAECAKKCARNGNAMGLLTDDGTLVLLEADPEHRAPYETIKEHAGERLSVTGALAEKDGMKIVTVLGAEAAG